MFAERNNNPNIMIEATNTCCALKEKKKRGKLRNALYRQRETISRGKEKGEEKKRIFNFHRIVTTSKQPPNVESHPLPPSFDRNRSGAAAVVESCSNRELLVGEEGERVMWQKRETIRVKVNRWEPMAVTGRLNSIIRRDEQFSLAEDEDEDGRL